MAPRPLDKTANEPLTVSLDLGKHTHRSRLCFFYSNLTLPSLKNRPLVPSPFFPRGRGGRDRDGRRLLRAPVEAGLLLPVEVRGVPHPLDGRLPHLLLVHLRRVRRERFCHQGFIMGSIGKTLLGESFGGGGVLKNAPHRPCGPA